MNNYQQRAGLSVSKPLCDLIEQEIAPGLGIDLEQFWAGFDQLINELAPQNHDLIEKREQLQAKLDLWCSERAGQGIDPEQYRAYLEEIGYLAPAVDDFTIRTDNVDEEIAELAGPQLVVPLKNARFALNAANARWGSLYDALYGTDVIASDGGAEAIGGYNPVRGQRVIEFARRCLDEHFPLEQGSHADACQYQIIDGGLEVALADGSRSTLANPAQLVGSCGDLQKAGGILLKNNGIHIEIQLDSEGNIGKDDPANIQDILCEAALTTIMDCEDSVTAVDAEDKTEVYRHWLGLMTGELSATFNKGGKTLTRRMNPDREYQTPDGSSVILPGRSLLFVRNVGHLMTNSAILFGEQREIPEGIMDAVLTSMAAMHNLQGNTSRQNSRKGSIYIVKPKMHGPEEVAFAVTVFERVEQLLGLPANTLKIGIMDEERRTTLNLKACIAEARERVVFVNTGFLDRTGDEIHTSMLAGAFVPKAPMKQQTWLLAYENWNVDIGLQCGFSGRAQIGKGMWPMPDEMAAMLEQKTVHPMAGANTAWVPSPTAATLHSLHYHQVNVKDRQQALMDREPASLQDLLRVPLLSEEDCKALSPEEIQKEINNNAQGILGYVVRWIDHGIGCSKVPDINNFGLMEDRATLRISSQYLANWIHHGLCTEAQVLESLKQMAKVVDQQNATDSAYVPMAPSYDGIAFKAACDLVFKGKDQPSGYTEPLLHYYRLEKKKAS